MTIYELNQTHMAKILLRYAGGELMLKLNG
jgi:hypothetical protein